MTTGAVAWRAFGKQPQSLKKATYWAVSDGGESTPIPVEVQRLTVTVNRSRLDSKAFGVRPNIDFLGPSAARLPKDLNHSFCDGVRRNRRFGAPIGLSRAELGRIDLPIDDDVNNVNSLRMKLAR
jgi:hypothetical protein